MKNKPLKPTHTIVLSIAVLMTVFSIVGSVAAAGLIPLVSDIDRAANEKEAQPNRDNNSPKAEDRQGDTSAQTSEFKKIEFKNHGFQSVVRPKLGNCFNCGVVTAIESTSANTRDWAMSTEEGLLNYLEAHRENARIIALDDAGENHVSEFEQLKDQAITYLIKVRMQDGSQRVIEQDTLPEHQVGDKVRLTVGKVTTA
jgi:hypothetical protein